MAKYRHDEFLLIVAFVLSCGCVVYGQEILGCGGFVKSKVKIDFSKVEVQIDFDLSSFILIISQDISFRSV